jgi:hypothetical protein
MKIEIGKKYTSNGKNLRIVCIDRKDILGYKVVGIFDNGDIKCFRSNGDSALDSKYDLQEVWQPQYGEWCLFWDDISKDMAIHLRIYSCMKDMLFKSADGLSWENCTKFIGELPEHLKGLKAKDINMKENT